MPVDSADLVRYRRATRHQPYIALDDVQQRTLDEHARRYRAWVAGHHVLHNTIGLALLAGLLTVDVGVALWAGRLSSPLLAVALVAVAHGYLTYSITTYTMHEGAGHGLLYLGRSTVARAIGRTMAGTCRLFFADPVFYASVHPSHHAHLATADDGAYTHYVALRRFLRSLLPLAGLLPFNDYVIHTDHSFSRSRVRSIVLGAAYHTSLLLLIRPATGAWLGLVALVILAPWVAFTLDRVRETYDHLFTPEHRRWGARSLGLGVAGMVFGGGPWGQPCHLSHHFAPGLPWYMQLRLHLDFRTVLRPDQCRALLTPRFSCFLRTYAQNIALMQQSGYLTKGTHG